MKPHWNSRGLDFHLDLQLIAHTHKYQSPKLTDFSFSIKFHELFSNENLKKTSILSMLKKAKTKSWIRPLDLRQHSLMGSSLTRPSTKFRGNPSSMFCAILLTNYTDKSWAPGRR